MSIMWKYLDKRAATIAALKDYGNMKFIIDHTDEQIAAKRDRMVGLASPNMDGMPHAHNPGAAEDRIVSAVDEIDILQERYRQAEEYMAWFKPAWEQLSDDEQYVLECFYGDANTYGGNAVHYVAEYFRIEQTSAYKRKNRALDRLTVLLFGKA